MRSGVSTSSYADTATFAGVVGTWSTDYPAANLGDTMVPSEVARVTPATGAAAFTGTLPAAVSMQFLALVEHTIPTAGTVRVRLYSDVLTTVVYDTTAVAIPDPVAGYPQTFPVLLDAPISVRSWRVDIAGLTEDLDIGACEPALFWEWPWVNRLEAGFLTSGEEADLVGGGSAGAEGELIAARDGEISFLDLAVSSTTGLDFQKLKGLTRPFVYLEDYDTPASFPRDCFLATNADVPASTAVLFDRDTFQFRIRRHVR